uniref:Uncharacterized protein n=1 Tax=Anguilla anguilla TaxID=7936 RepID=A0A0E9SJW5_ANGAN
MVVDNFLKVVKAKGMLL